MNLQNKSIAIAGVSHNSSKYGNKVFSDLVRAGYNVYGVNRSGGMVEKRLLYTSISELPIVPEILVTVVPPEVTEKLVDEAYSLGITHIWMQPGSESDNAIEKAKRYGMIVTAHACIMVDSGLW